VSCLGGLGSEGMGSTKAATKPSWCVIRRLLNQCAHRRIMLAREDTYNSISASSIVRLAEERIWCFEKLFYLLYNYINYRHTAHN